MSEQKHTPTPWFLVGTQIYRRPKSDLYEFGGPVAGDKPMASASKGWYGEDADGFPAEANAAHIVKCVNCHDDLLEALKGLMADISGGEKSCGHEFTCVCAGDKARAAIAKAEGKPQ